MTVQDCSDLDRFLEDIRYRRSWLLIQALRDETLDRALVLAQRCDDFVTGIASDPAICSVVEDKGAAPWVESEQPCEDPPEPPAIPAPAAPPATRSNLSLPDRERLISRLAEGAKNAELAAELGLSTKQVQGIRMGCAREIRRRRERQEIDTEPSNAATPTASLSDVVRYLRQQDDIVVPQEGRAFLVNGRFWLSTLELVSRANRMRVRQGKPEFELEGACEIRTANDHHRLCVKPVAVA